eukprot:tig00000788_g4067.t1
MFRSLSNGTGSVRTVCFTPDGASVLAAGPGSVARIWRVSDGTVQRTLKHDDFVTVLAAGVSPDGALAVTGTSVALAYVWSMSNGTQLRSLNNHTNGIAAVAFFSNDVLATASFDASVILWSASTGSVLRVLRGHTDWVYGIAFIPHSALLGPNSGPELRTQA